MKPFTIWIHPIPALETVVSEGNPEWKRIYFGCKDNAAKTRPLLARMSHTGFAVSCYPGIEVYFNSTRHKPEQGHGKTYKPR